MDTSRDQSGWLELLDEMSRQPEAAFGVSCSGSTHDVSIERGRMTLHSHNTDAERALKALGSDAPACLALLDAWMFFSTEEYAFEGVSFLLFAKHAPRRAAARPRSEEAARRAGRVGVLMGCPEPVRYRMAAELLLYSLPRTPPKTTEGLAALAAELLAGCRQGAR